MLVRIEFIAVLLCGPKMGVGIRVLLVGDMYVNIPNLIKTSLLHALYSSPALCCRSIAYMTCTCSVV
jgi:hypothetical protein